MRGSYLRASYIERFIKDLARFEDFLLRSSYKIFKSVCICHKSEDLRNEVVCTDHC